MNDKKSIWNEAAVAGLVLGVIPMLYLYLSGIVGTLFSILLWIVKFGACIFLMKYFLKKYSRNNPDADHSDVFRFGMLAAFLSALLFSGFTMAYLTFINPDMIREVFDSMMENYSSMLDSNARDQMDALISKTPTILFFSTLVYCWLFGTVLSAIFSKEIPSDNPFDSNTTETENEQ